MTKRRGYGVSHIENSITNLLKPLHNKDKKNFLIISNIIKNWEKVVGKKYVNLCAARSIGFDKGGSGQKKAKLIINVYNPAVGFFLQNNSELILDRIAQLYGYRAVHKITIKQEAKEVNLNKNKEPNLTETQKKSLESQIKDVKNTDLQEILSKLGADIMSGDKK